MSAATNNKIIAKNTLALYFRTFITMLVGLYTSRVMLQALGVDNYGINNVVGGIVGMSSLITSTMSQAVSRYITYALGTGDKDNLNKMFSTAVNVQILLSIIAVIVMELFGLWFLNNQASIPEGRMSAAHWVFHCSLISLVIGLISSPYGALIIAHERMGIYAYASIAEVLLKLGIVFLIIKYDGDRLILFAILSVFVCLVMQLFYAVYCRLQFAEARYKPNVFDKGLFKELSVFGGWNLLNNGAWVFATQGVNMLVNVFFGVAFNAARGIAQSVNGAIQSFVTNFTIAFTPQMTKSYAAGDISYSVSLCNRGIKFAWLMMFIFIVPVCCEADTILHLWLGEVPEWSVLFVRLGIFESLSVTVGQNLLRLIQADGQMKHYTIYAAIIAGLIFPLTWCTYLLGAPVWISYLIFIFDFIILNVMRLFYLKQIMSYSIREFVYDVLRPCLVASLISFVIPIAICNIMPSGFARFLINVPVAILWTSSCCFVLGLNEVERKFLREKVVSTVNRIKK